MEVRPEMTEARLEMMEVDLDPPSLFLLGAGKDKSRCLRSFERWVRMKLVVVVRRRRRWKKTRE